MAGGQPVAPGRERTRRSVVGDALGRVMAATALAVLVLTAGCRGLVTRGEPAEVREPAPEFTLASHDGRTISLSDLLARGPALVVFYRGHW